MTHWKSIATTAIAVTILVAGLGTGASAWRSDSGRSGWWGGGEAHGWSNRDRGHQRSCDGAIEDHLEVVEAYGRQALDLRAEQRPAYRALVQQVRATLPRLRSAACGTAGSPGDPLDELDRGLATAREAIAEIRPAWKSFVDGLDGRQKAVLMESLQQ